MVNYSESKNGGEQYIWKLIVAIALIALIAFCYFSYNSYVDKTQKDVEFQMKLSHDKEKALREMGINH